MSVRVLDLEWTRPLPTVIGLDKEGLLGLVRVHGKPVGLVRMKAPEGAVEATHLRRAIRKQVKLPPTEAREKFTAPGFQPVSIIVSTRDRADHLARCLEALVPLGDQGHEVIIVDNAPSSPAAAELVENYPFRYLLEQKPGLDHARNRGLAEASNEIVAFTDDDCLPDPDWANALAAALTSGEISAVTGLVLPAELNCPAQQRYEAYCANRRIFQPKCFSRKVAAPSTAGVVGMGANMAFRRHDLEQIGGFDPRFDGGTPTLSGGDTEVFARLLDLGRQIAYTPDAIVWHSHPVDDGALRRTIYGYGAGLYAFLTKRLVEDRDLGVLVTAPRWLVGPPLKALWNLVRGRPAAPLDLLLSELSGAFSGPGRFHRACQKNLPPKSGLWMSRKERPL
jgi:GT2 family glycosyltransferase